MTSAMPAAAGGLARDRSIAARALGVFRHPRAALRDAIADRRWGGLLALVTAAMALPPAMLFATDVGRLALVDQWERTAAAFGRPLDDAAYARLLQLSADGVWYALATALLSGPVLVCLVAALVYALFGRGRRGDVTWAQVAAVVTTASVVLAARQLLAAPLAYIRESTASATTVGAWFPGLDEASLLARFLGALDLFVLWWLALVAIGVGTLYTRSHWRLAAAFAAVYVAIVVALALTMAALGGAA